MNYVTYFLIVFLLVLNVQGQNHLENKGKGLAYAENLVYEGNNREAQGLLEQMYEQEPNNNEIAQLLARVYSFNGQYLKARHLFNRLTSKHKESVLLWIAAIKNELYAKEYNIALGISNKAMQYSENEEIKRLHILAMTKVKSINYPEFIWEEDDISKVRKKSKSKNGQLTLSDNSVSSKKEAPTNRIGVSNAVSIFSERFDPMLFSNIAYNKRTRYGTIIPRINYSSRSGKQGVQLDLDLYPKLAKKVYAYLNYGYSSASIYPKHKAGGEVYVNLPNAVELSAGGRYIVTATQNITGITSSVGYYKGNYYFSLRSFITPKQRGLTRVSANLLVRKYLKDAENFIGISGGMGVEPELRQFIVDGELLAESLLYIESQRLNLEYQFTGKKNKNNLYRARLGAQRQEVAFDSGRFFFGFTAGLTYNIKF